MHGAAMQRVRVTEDGHRTRFALGQIEQSLERAGWARNLTQKF